MIKSWRVKWARHTAYKADTGKQRNVVRQAEVKNCY